MAKPLVFSFVNEQRRFLFLLIGFLTFLTVTSSGIVLSISTALGRFQSSMERTGIIQVMQGGNIDTARKIINENKNNIEDAKEIDKTESAKLLKNWLRSADALLNYIPQMIEVKTKTTAGLDTIAKSAEANKLRFVYSKNAGAERSVGIKIIMLSGFIFLVVLCALIVCITHSVKNIITIHKHEIEILNQIGATTGYIAWQIQKAMISIGAKSTSAGLVAGWIMLAIINGLSRTAQVGLLANMGMDLPDWIITGTIALLLVALIVFITSRTTLKILGGR